ncbi:TPA: transcriptional regulator, partial [Burkholderia multivorans]|nr:transcriptional regulator [Burkholderia multivorans]
ALPAWRYFIYVPATRIDDEAVRAFRDWLKLAGCAENSNGLR